MCIVHVDEVRMYVEVQQYRVVSKADMCIDKTYTV